MAKTVNNGKRTEPLFSFEQVPGSLNRLSREYRTDGTAFRDEVCTSDLNGRSFHECTFTNVTFEGDLSGVLFADAVFDHCDLSNCRMNETVFRRAVLKHCRLTGTDLSSSTFEDLLVSGCQCAYTNFNGSRMKRTEFMEDNMTECGLSMCTLDNTSFVRCMLNGAELIDTKLGGIDFSDSSIEGISVTPETIRGVVVNEEQAVAFAKLLGIIVR